MFKILLILSIFIAGISKVNAESRANVRVNNNVSGSSTSNIESHTNITVETNGQTTTYTSDKPENIELNSLNGKSEIKVDGKTVSKNNDQANPSATPSTKPTVKPEKTERENKNIFDFFGNLLRKIFLLF